MEIYSNINLLADEVLALMPKSRSQLTYRFYFTQEDGRWMDMDVLQDSPLPDLFRRLIAQVLEIKTSPDKKDQLMGHADEVERVIYELTGEINHLRNHGPHGISIAPDELGINLKGILDSCSRLCEYLRSGSLSRGSDAFRGRYWAVGCRVCFGAGVYWVFGVCPDCHGMGKEYQREKHGYVICPRCQGAGRANRFLPCPRCSDRRNNELREQSLWWNFFYGTQLVSREEPVINSK